MSGMLRPPTRSCASRILIGHVQSAHSFPAPGRPARHVLRPRPRQALLHPGRTYHPTTSAAPSAPHSLGICHLCSERAVSPGSLHSAPSRRRWFARPGMTMNASSTAPFLRDRSWARIRGLPYPGFDPFPCLRVLELEDFVLISCVTHATGGGSTCRMLPFPN